jgi:LmbE family N-acetylglucosaminyl deacetylase
MKRILVISPHADDGELWAGASMARWAAADAEIDHVCLSALGDDDRLAEFYAASEVLGVSPHPFPFEDTDFPMWSDIIFAKLEELNDTLKPDLVIVPPSGDRHQDHAVVHEEAKRAFRFCSLLGFDIPYNEPSVRPTWYQSVSASEMKCKTDALACYKSQSHHSYMWAETVVGLARVRGEEIRKGLAEAFEVIRWVN